MFSKSILPSLVLVSLGAISCKPDTGNEGATTLSTKTQTQLDIEAAKAEIKEWEKQIADREKNIKTIEGTITLTKSAITAKKTDIEAKEKSYKDAKAKYDDCVKYAPNGHDDCTNTIWPYGAFEKSENEKKAWETAKDELKALEEKLKTNEESLGNIRKLLAGDRKILEQKKDGLAALEGQHQSEIEQKNQQALNDKKNDLDTDIKNVKNIFATSQKKIAEEKLAHSNCQDSGANWTKCWSLDDKYKASRKELQEAITLAKGLSARAKLLKHSEDKVPSGQDIELAQGIYELEGLEPEIVCLKPGKSDAGFEYQLEQWGSKNVIRIKDLSGKIYELPGKLTRESQYQASETKPDTLDVFTTTSGTGNKIRVYFFRDTNGDKQYRIEHGSFEPTYMKCFSEFVN